MKFKLAVIVYRALLGAAPRSVPTCLIGWAALLTCRLGVDFGRQLPTNLLSVRRVLSQLANDHLLLT